MSITAGSIMDRSASLLNDTAKTLYTYVAQVPYLSIALDELKEELEDNNVPVVNKTSGTLVVTTDMIDIGGSSGPALPADFIDLISVYERTSGTTENFQEMTKVSFLPKFNTLTASLRYYSWQGNVIRFLGANSNRDVMLEYMADVIGTIVDDTSTISMNRAKSTLIFRTAALCAEFIGENTTRADKLNGYAQMALDRLLNRETKGKQSIVTRRKPFMFGLKMRGN